MRALWRLAIWGAAGTASLAAAVLAANTDLGSQRLMTAMAIASGQPSAVAALPAETETENETRRLSAAIQMLDADRERLLIRVASLERSLDDITGSVRRQVTSAPETPAPAVPLPPIFPPSLYFNVVDASPANRTSGAPNLPAAESAEPTAGRLAAVSAGYEAADAETTKPEIAVDIGGAANLDGLRLLWNSAKAAHAGLFENLHPLVAVRENPKTRASELRLLVGPFTDTEAAASVCSALSGVRRFCQPTAFEGQRFSLAEPERKPVATPPRRPATPPKAARQNP